MITDERARLDILRSYAVLDSAPEPEFDRVTALARLVFDTPMATVSLVDDHRQWFKSRQGVGVCETPRSQAFCAHALPLRRGVVLVVSDATQDARFADNPLVTGPPNIRFYAGAVLTTPEGANLGTLCVIDTVARPDLTEVERRTLSALADLVMSELEVRRAHRRDAAKLELLQLAEQMSGVGRWRLELGSGAVEWSDEVYRIHGVDRAGFDPQLDSALDFYDAEGRAAVASHLAEAVERRSGFSFQLRLRRADGSWRQVVCKASCELDPRGEPVALVGVFQDVTEQADLLRQVTEDRERYRLLTQNATDVIATYRPDGVFTYLSPACERLLGRSPEALIGRRTFELIDARDHERVSAAFQALVASGETSTRIEYRTTHADGSPLWLEAHPTPIRDPGGRLVGFQDAVRDVTARRAAQDEAAAALAWAQESEARYRLLAENANDMISTTALDSTVLFVTPAVERLLGYTPEEIVGRKTLELTHPDDTEAVVALFTGVLAAGASAAVTPYQFRGRHKAGHWVWLEGQPRVQFDADGRPLVFQDVVRDITARKRMEVELDTARRGAEAAAQAKSDFLANMSHELRTPLTAILGFTALAAKQEELAPRTRDYMTRVQSASRALLSTVNDILDFSKLEAGQVTLREAPTNVLQVCREAVDLFIPQAAAKNLRLKVETGDQDPPPLLLDAERLLQLLLNLVGNAVKFTETGSVIVRVGHAADRLRIEVIDTGPGITKAALPRLFQRFSQADGSSTRSHGGTGLGLAICKGLAERMGGSIGAESRIGRGSTFRLELPGRPCAPASCHPAQAEAPLPDLEGLRLLVVDDNGPNRELARLILAGAGAETTEAESGASALELLAAEPFDAVLLDLHMGGLDGRAVLRRLRSTPGLNDNIPVIAYTATDQPAGVLQAQMAEFDGWVSKPLHPPQLLEAITRALDGTPPPQAEAAHG